MQNNNRFILILLLTIFVSAASISKAECDGFYLAGRLGSAKIELEDKRSGVSDSVSNYIVDKRRFLASGGIGYRYKHFRAELEYIWRKKNSDTVGGITTGTFRSSSYMFVVYYDLFPYSWFTPYIDAGVGYSRNHLRFYNNAVDVAYRIKDNSFTWSLGAGLSLKVTNRLNVDLGYRYYDMGELSALNGDTDLTNQEIYVGLRYVL